MNSNERLDYQIQRCLAVCEKKGWTKDWIKGGCYIHLEVSEFIESLRGKGGDPTSEAADVLITLFSVLAYYKIHIVDVMAKLDETLDQLEDETK